MSLNPKSEIRNPRLSRGVVYLVGAGPGDPKLLTLKALELLRQADVVVYDHLVSPEILKHCPQGAKSVYVGKKPKTHNISQEVINARLIREAKSGKCVVRLKGGDPMLFGRGGEEALALAKSRIRFEIVPGVTSAIAVPAYAGIPVTHRELSSSVAVITGHEDPTKAFPQIRWGALSAAVDTLVFLMSVGNLPNIVERLKQASRPKDEPCAVIEQGTRSSQRVVTGSLDTIARQAAQASIRPPAVFVVGDVVSLRDRLAWFETKPLFGTRVLVTRSSEKANSLMEPLETLGAEVECLPVISLAAVHTNGLFREAIRTLSKTDWVFFTSPEGMGWFKRLLGSMRKDIRVLAGCRIGAIGPATAAAIEAAGVNVDYVPNRFNQQRMLQEFPRRFSVGKRAVIFSARGSRDVLEQGLRQRGMTVTKVSIYQAVMPKNVAKRLSELLERPYDLVSVTSASCVEHLAQALAMSGQSQLMKNLHFASIGPVTSRAVRARGGCVVLEASVSTIEGLVAAISRYVRRQHS